MVASLKYTPIFRVRQEEQKVMTTFEFGDHIYPYVEIIKEIIRKQPTHRKGVPIIPKTKKTFEGDYSALIKKINSRKVFVDLPVHMDDGKGVDPEVVTFLRKVVANRKERTAYMIKLASLSDKIIPVISTYSQRAMEANTITSQASDLRPHFKSIAFRTFPKTFYADMMQIEFVAQPDDFLIIDLDDFVPDPKDEEVMVITNRIKSFDKCHIIIVRSALSDKLTNVGLDHGNEVADTDNRLLKNYHEMYGNSFGDYAGIKKDKVADGGTISPGFIYFDAKANCYVGFKGTANKDLDDYANIIVPSVLKSNAYTTMKAMSRPYLSTDNKGNALIHRINDKIETGRNAPKFKRIAMEHYLHCLKTMINEGDFA